MPQIHAEHQHVEPRVDMAAYTLVTSALRLDYPNRLYIASVAGYMANHGPNVKLIAGAIGKSEPFVRKLIRVVEKLLAEEDVVG